MKEVKVSSRAQRDIRRLRAWLEVKNASAADRAGEAIARGIFSLRNPHERGQSVSSGNCELRVRFGTARYVLRYRVRDEDVMIIRIFHGRERRL